MTPSGEGLRRLVRRVSAGEATVEQLLDAVVDGLVVVPSVAPAGAGLSGFEPLSHDLPEGRVWAVYPVADVPVGPTQLARFSVTLPGRDLLRIVPPGTGLALDLGAVHGVIVTSDELDRYRQSSRVRADQVCGPHGVGVYRGVALRSHPGQKGTILLDVPAERAHLVEARDVLAEYPWPSGRRLKLPLAAVSRSLWREWWATWHDEPVRIAGQVDATTGLVRIEYERDPAFADRWGLSGDQRDGWWVDAPFDELVDVRLVEREVPQR